MSIRLYNSLVRKLESFEPHNGKQVQMFVCGPTVYDFIHLGNARTFTIFDVVAKWLRYRGYEVDYVQNITDVDDKIIARGVDAKELTEQFKADMAALGNDAVSRYAPATDYIPQVITQVKALIAKGNVYLIESDGWYFDLTTFPDYGKLSGRTGGTADDAVSRIDDSDKKRNAGDFCVWKLKKEGEPSWPDDQLGEGRPGWHIEDTAITEKLFGPQYDLHGGGMDLKFPHHEAEIAQQESASGKVPFVKYWMHAGFLQIKDEKMSKSKGNFLTLHDALKRYSPEALRFFFLSNHYRSPLELTDQSLKSAEAAVQRIAELARKASNVPEAAVSLSAIEEAMDDDFNTAAAFAAIFEIVRDANKKNMVPPRSLFDFVSSAFGILQTSSNAVPEDIQQLVDQRQTAREAKDFAKADTLRDQIASQGYAVDDTPYGPLVKKQ